MKKLLVISYWLFSKKVSFQTYALRLPTIAVVLSTLIFSSCSQQLNKSDYLKWLNSEESGLVKSKTVNGITMSLKYLPVDYLAYQEVDDPNSITKDEFNAIKQELKDSWNFVLAIGPEDGNGDIMYTGVSNKAEFNQLVHSMNFGLENQVTLKIGDAEYHPVLSNMENIYGLKGDRKILFAFTPEETIEDFSEVLLTYDDQLFGLGLNNFRFERSSIENTTEIKI